MFTFWAACLHTNTKCTRANKSYSHPNHQSSPKKNNTHAHTHCHHCLLGRLLVAACCIFNASLLYQLYNECLIPPLVAWGEHDRAQPTGPRRPWNIHIRSCWVDSRWPFSLKVNNIPAVTPSTRPNHINEARRGEIQRESQGLRVCPFVFVSLHPTPSLSNMWRLFSQPSAAVLKSVCCHKGQSFSCCFRLFSWENWASFMFTS